MLAYNLNCWLLLFQREADATPEKLRHTTLATARLRFLFVAAKIWRHAGRTGVSYSDQYQEQGLFERLMRRLQACVPTPRPPELEAVLATIREYRDEALALLTTSGPPPEKLPPIFKGQAVCLYSDQVGENLWIVADEEDAQTLVAQGERRGQVYTPEEVRLIIRITDAEIVKQVHAFKSELNARMRDDDQR